MTICFVCVAEEYVNLIVKTGVVTVLVKHLEAPPELEDGQQPYEHEVEKGSAFALGLLAVKVISSVYLSLSFLLFF